jgi:hypothetical protein
MAFEEKIKIRRKKVELDLTYMPIQKEFFIRRFAKLPECDTAYYEEWEERFRSGHPESYMDSESSAIYHKILEERRLGK